MSYTRIIARLDIKGPNLIKGIQLEGLRVIGDPNEHARAYYQGGADEIVLMDAVASLYGRNNLKKIIQQTVREIFIPITVGGGIRSIDDATEILRYGADKVAINTAAIKNPELITAIATRFGRQCMVLSVEAKQNTSGGWEAYIDNGREHTGRDVSEWVREAVSLGAGEILLTSVDNEGTQKGFDIELIKAFSKELSVPVIASGGMGNIDHLDQALSIGGADAVAIASVLHYNKMTLSEIKELADQAGHNIRPHKDD